MAARKVIVTVHGTGSGAFFGRQTLTTETRHGRKMGLTPWLSTRTIVPIELESNERKRDDSWRASVCEGELPEIVSSNGTWVNMPFERRFRNYD
jgi:hypothetical protein